MEIRDTRNGSWYWVNTAVNACPHITHAEKCVYGALASFGGCKDIHPSFEIIAQKSNVTQRLAMKAVKKMAQLGLISIQRGGGRGNANVYTLLKCPNGCNLCLKGEQKNTVSECKERVNKKTIKGEQNSTPIDKVIDKEIDKIILHSEPSSQINPLIKLFEPINPNYENLYRNKTQRKALEEMVKKHGLTKMTEVITALPKIIDQKYAPTITTPLQLQNKLGDLVIFVRKQNQPKVNVAPAFKK